MSRFSSTDRFSAGSLVLFPFFQKVVLKVELDCDSDRFDRPVRSDFQNYAWNESFCWRKSAFYSWRRLARRDKQPLALSPGPTSKLWPVNPPCCCSEQRKTTRHFDLLAARECRRLVVQGGHLQRERFLGGEWFSILMASSYSTTTSKEAYTPGLNPLVTTK
ncbi:hypothetical protein PIB30_019561 [Stylosanthes scabra]|uniref:Uncharacterized protein n=1 Tax=Stylosanthes scabra TaxID=79078 RepID=A0ABU6X6J6_9FABA|nr:hypothetical protein [Stylosanthes scabra]